jgi:hypothetical protein
VIVPFPNLNSLPAADRSDELHPNLVGQEVPVVDGQVRDRRNSPEVRQLVLSGIWMPGPLADDGGEVTDPMDVVAGKGSLAERGEVEPAVRPIFKAAVEEVEAVDVDVRAYKSALRCQKSPPNASAIRMRIERILAKLVASTKDIRARRDGGATEALRPPNPARS